MKLSESLLALTKKIIRGAVGVGIDEAGARICGPTAWKYVKKALSPVITELEHRFPKVFLLPEEAKKAEATLSSDNVFVKMLNKGFANLKSGQKEILAILAQQNETLSLIGKNVDDGFAQLGKEIGTLKEVLEYVTGKLNKLDINVDTFITSKGVQLPSYAQGLTPDQIYNQAFTYQSDAQRWVEAGEADAASERLANARPLVEAGLKRYPKNAFLLVSLGYIEKTQAQAALLQRDYEEYVYRLQKAAKCFAAVLRDDPSNVGALNGMANVYYYQRDYDRAIDLGSLAVDSAPEYGAASWDLAISLEAKLKECGSNQSLINKLKMIYRHLETLMPQQPQMFSANDLSNVHRRLKALQSK